MRGKYYQLLIFSLLIVLCWGKITTAQTNPHTLVRQGVGLYQQGQVTAAIDNWQTALNFYKDAQQLDNQTVVLENLARAYQKLGKSNLSLNYWEQTTSNYKQLGQSQLLGRSLTEQAQIYARLGQHQQAIAILCGTDTPQCRQDSAVEIAHQHQDRLGEAAAWGSLGETYRLRGDYQLALDYLLDSLVIATKNKLVPLKISALNSLGKTYSSLAQVSYRRAASARKRGEDFGENNVVKKLETEGLNYDRQGIEYLTKSRQLAKQQGNNSAQLKAIVNSLPVYYRLGEDRQAAQQLEQAIALLPSLAPTADKIYAQVNLAKLLQPKLITPHTCYSQQTQSRAKKLIQQAAREAATLADNRVQSFAVGELGHISECQGDYQTALKLSQNARLLAEQELQSKDSLYLWEWQTARIYQQQGNTKDAIRAYQQAIATLDSIRNSILTANRDIQFNFRDRIEPIYRELIALELETVPTNTLIAASNESLNLALNVFDSLQLAELQNYFGNDCAIDEASIKPDQKAERNTVAVFHSIILPDRTAIVATFPNGDRQLNWIYRERESLREDIIALNEGLIRWYDNQYDPTLATSLYNQIVKPFIPNLERQQIKTLVFIQDGILRNVPMSALYDGREYLIEKYAVATTPSLTVTRPKSLKRKNLKVLALGLTESSSINGVTYPALPQIRSEIEKIEREFKNSKPLLDSQFTRERLQQELEQESYPIVHIASHATFDAEPQNTFLLTGNNQTLSINELDRLIRNAPQGNKPIELLSLTACETALGDERATLGLAGVAVQAGARSAIASLWLLNDSVTPQLVEQFYASLQNPNFNKAQALQTAQLSLIEQELHPAYWASFILIGNWL